MLKASRRKQGVPDQQVFVKKGKIVVSKNGPYLVSGSLPLGKEISQVGDEGEPERWVKGEQYPDQEKYALCRCGKSRNHPFCDGAHVSAGFDGTETAGRKSYAEQAVTTEGPGLDLKDVESLCAWARFCKPKGGTRKLTLESDDPEKRKIAIQQCSDCPSGRLVACDKKTGKPIEPEFEPSISLIEDPRTKSSGPIWVKGGAAIESGDGDTYEVRNRATLCRCGRSKNKPFCDGCHIRARFNDGDGSLTR
jgi:CDGSH-type Zn-finger protein